MDLIGAKIIDEDTQKHNLRREGIISNAMGFMNRLNSFGFSFFINFDVTGKAATPLGTRTNEG